MDNDDREGRVYFKFLVNCVYKELLNQFMNKGGKCEASTYLLINFNLVLTEDDKSEYLSI